MPRKSKLQLQMEAEAAAAIQQPTTDIAVKQPKLDKKMDSNEIEAALAKREKDKDYDKLKKLVPDLKEIITKLKQQIADLNNQIAALNDQIKAHENTIAEYSAEIARLQDEAAKSNATIAELNDRENIHQQNKARRKAETITVPVTERQRMILDYICGRENKARKRTDITPEIFVMFYIEDTLCKGNKFSMDCVPDSVLADIDKKLAADER